MVQPMKLLVWSIMRFHGMNHGTEKYQFCWYFVFWIPVFLLRSLSFEGQVTGMTL